MAKITGKSYSNMLAEQQFKRGMCTLLVSIIQTQGQLKFVLNTAKGTMDDEQLGNMEIYGKLCQLDSQLDETFKGLCNELTKEDLIMKNYSQEKYAERLNGLGKSHKSTSQLKIKAQELLKVMPRDVFKKLVSRGKLIIERHAPMSEVLLESIPIRYVLDLAERQGCSNESSPYLFRTDPSENADSSERDYATFQPIASVFRRVDRQSLHQKNPRQVGVLVSVDEYERFCKTPIGRFYISSFDWEKCNLLFASV